MMRATPTDELTQAYARDGAIKAAAILDASQLAQCKTCYDWGMANPSQRAVKVFAGTEHEHYNDVANPAAWQSGYKELIEELPFAEYLSALWGSEQVFYFGEELFAKAGGKVGRSPWHQDRSYVPFDGAHWANIWITFEPLAAKNSLEIVRGSHLGILYNGSSYDDPEDVTKPLHLNCDLPRLPDIEADRANNTGSWDVISWPTQCGDAIVCHPGVLHGGAPIDALTPERHTLVLRFFGDDATVSPLPDTDWPWLEDQTAGAPFRSAHFPQIR